MQIYQEIQIG